MDFPDDFESTPRAGKRQHESLKDCAPFADSFEPHMRLQELDDEESASLTSQALNPDGTPRRPMNAFMIFARRRRPQISAENQSMRTGEVSKILSKEWSSMTTSDKQFYLDQAKILKDNFNAKYPDYVYRRRPNNSRRRKKPEEGHSVADSSAPSDEGSEPSPISEAARLRHSHSPVEKTSRSLPYPVPGSISRRHTISDDLLPPLWNTSSRDGSRTSWPNPSSWSAISHERGGGSSSYTFAGHHSPFYPSSTTNPSSYHSLHKSHSTSSFGSSSTRGFEVNLPGSRQSTSRSSSHSPFDYLGEYSSSNYTSGVDPFSAPSRVSPTLGHSVHNGPELSSYTTLPPLQNHDHLF